MKKYIKFLPAVPAFLAFVFCLLPFGFMTLQKGGPDMEEVRQLHAYLSPILIVAGGTVSPCVCSLASFLTIGAAILCVLRDKSFGLVIGGYVLGTVSSLAALDRSAENTPIGIFITLLLLLGTVLCFLQQMWRKLHE